MGLYRVTINSAAWEQFEVEADSAKEAEDLAFAQATVEAPEIGEVEEL